MRSFGVVKWFGGYNKNTDRENNFGFISDRSGEDIFLHKNECDDDQPIEENDVVFYNLEKDKGKWKATNAKRVSRTHLTLLELDEALQEILESEVSFSGEFYLERSLRSSFCERLLNAAPDEVRLFFDKSNNHEIWRSLSESTNWPENLDKLLSLNLVNPLKEIPWNLLPADYFTQYEEDVSEHLSKLEVETARELIFDLLSKFPVSLVLFLVLKNILSSENELGLRYKDLKIYIEAMISDGVNNHPDYVNNVIELDIKPKGGMRGHPILGKIIDISLFRKYLFEKNIKFTSLYQSSPYLQSRNDIFILNDIFSLILAKNDIALTYEIFLGHLWEAITNNLIDPISQQRELHNLFPSCYRMPDELFCEAMYWKKLNKFLCRGRNCSTPKVIPDLTKHYLNFTIYDWFAHYNIDYLNEKEPSSRDFPIKLAGYLNRIIEIYEVIHCRSCKSLMLPDMRYSRVEHTVFENGQLVTKEMAASYRLTVFKCPNGSCQEYNQGYYINHCIGFGCYDIIDTRDLRTKCDASRYICKGCGGCCGEHSQSNPVGLCPDCGSPLKLYADVNDTSHGGYQNRFVKCSSSHCNFSIPKNKVPKKFYLQSCGDPIKIRGQSRF